MLMLPAFFASQKNLKPSASLPCPPELPFGELRGHTDFEANRVKSVCPRSGNGEKCLEKTITWVIIPVNGWKRKFMLGLGK